MVLRGLRFPALVALATAFSISTAHANGSTASAGHLVMSYGEGKPVVRSYPRPGGSLPTDAGCDPRAYLGRDVEIEDLPDIVRLAYLKKMSAREYPVFMKNGGNSQIIPNRELPVILSFAEFKKLVRYEMDFWNIKIYAGRYDYLFRSSLSPMMERAYLRCLREQREPFLDVKIEPDAFEPFETNETERRVFVHIAWFGVAPLMNVRLIPRGDLATEPPPPTGTASDSEPSPVPVFELLRPGASQDVSLILKQNTAGAKSFLAVSADGIESRVIAFYQMGAASVSFKPKQVKLNPMSTAVNGFLKDVQRECLAADPEGELFVSTARISTLVTPQTQKGRVSSILLKDPQPESRQVCFEAQAAAPKKGSPAEGTATLEVWEITPP